MCSRLSLFIRTKSGLCGDEWWRAFFFSVEELTGNRQSRRSERRGRQEKRERGREREGKTEDRIQSSP